MEYNESNNENESTVRGGMKRVAAAAAAAGIAAKVASAQQHTQVNEPPEPPEPVERCVLVQLYLRGGADGLTLCVPEDEPNYHAKRNETRVYKHNDATAPPGRNGTLIEPAAGGRTGFALPPALVDKFKPLYDSGQLCFVQAVGSEDETRSHFSQQAFTELGETSATTNSDGNGWLGRYLESTAPRGDGTLRALAFGTVKITSYNGGNGVTPTLDPVTFDYPVGNPLRAHLQTLYAADPNPVEESLQNDLGAIDKLQAVNWADVSTLGYSNLRTQFQRAFEVIRDVDDIEVISIDFDNENGERWDTHNIQGVFDGAMFNLMTILADAVDGFVTDIATLRDRRVVLLIYTEFGRTLQENDGFGTDHGRGGACMLVGDDVNGGQVYTDPWPGLADDLEVTVDIRDIQGEAISKCLGANVNDVFPADDYVYKNHGLIRDN